MTGFISIGMSDHRDVLLNAILLFFSVSLVIGGLEALLLTGVVEQPTTEYRWCEGPDTRLQFHPVYGWTEHPNQQYIVKKAGSEWNVHTYNTDGFRDTYNSGDGNIVVVGDSFTRGVLADDNSTYPHLLDRWSPNTSFRNYGTVGYGTQQELLVYQNISNRYQHDVVVLGYYMGNDMNDNVDSDPRRPQFGVENGTAVQTAPPTNVSGTPPNPNPLYSVDRFMKRNSRAYDFIRPNLRATAVTLGLLNDIKPKPPSGEELLEQKRVTRHLLSRMATETTQHNATLLIVSIPERGEINPDKPSHHVPADAREYAAVQRELLRNVASNHTNTHYLSLKPQLNANHSRGKTLYGTANAHMTEYGYRVTAQVIYRWLVANDELRFNGNANFSKNYGDQLTTCR